MEQNIFERNKISMNVLIKDTTREEREKIVKDGIALSSLDSAPPTEDGMKLFNKYIEGELELEEIEKIILAPYKNNA